MASHAIDALCVLAAAAASPALEHTLCQGDGMGEDMEWLQQAMPEGVDVSWIERKPRYHKQNIDSQPLFKEGIFAQRFLPVWVDTKGVRIGFDYVKTLTRKGPTEIENEY